MLLTIAAQIEQLREKGYVVIRGFVPDEALPGLNDLAAAELAARAEPVEFEADLRYPGAPASRTAAGGTTVRRLLDAYGRAPEFSQRATAPAVRQWMSEYFGEGVRLSRAHHNCLMTKHPLFGSLTGWHRDIRYWSFARDDLVSVWLALGEEHADNGALWLVPGSHRMNFDAERFDSSKFFSADKSDNAVIVAGAESPRLAPGDALFFHCNTLHAAGKNRSNRVKFSLVYTFHGESNDPEPGTRSSSLPEISLVQ